MPLIIRIQTVGLEEGDAVPLFQNVLMLMQQPPADETAFLPLPEPPPPIVDQSWLHFPLELP